MEFITLLKSMIPEFIKNFVQNPEFSQLFGLTFVAVSLYVSITKIAPWMTRDIK